MLIQRVGLGSFGHDRPGSVYTERPGLRVRPSHPARTGLGAAQRAGVVDGAPMLKTDARGATISRVVEDVRGTQKVLNSPRALAESAAARQAWGEKQAARAIDYAKKAGRDASRVRETYNRALMLDDDGLYPLYDDFLLHGRGGAFTVADVLDNPEKYHECAIDDPVEPGTGREQDQDLHHRATCAPPIHCFAHGGAKYKLVAQQRPR